MNWLIKNTEQSSRRTLWRLRLAEFDLAFNYRKGKENNFADAMLQLHTDGETEVGDEGDIPSLQTTRPTRTDVPTLDNGDPDYDDSDEITAFIKQEYD